jgi:hypothetical protein
MNVVFLAMAFMKKIEKPFDLPFGSVHSFLYTNILQFIENFPYEKAIMEEQKIMILFLC